MSSDGVDKKHCLGKLVACDLFRRDREQGLGLWSAPGFQSHQGHHFLSPSFRGTGADQNVSNVGMAGEGMLHLFGKDLLSTCVNRAGIPSLEVQLAILKQPDPVSGDGIADAVHDREGI